MSKPNARNVCTAGIGAMAVLLERIENNNTIYGIVPLFTCTGSFVMADFSLRFTVLELL